MPPLTFTDYHVGIICALSKERAAVEAMLDEEHDMAEAQDPQDKNSYTLGCIHRHSVVIACLPEGVDGTNAAATVASHMIRTFTALKIGLLVGIGGGIPDLANNID